MIKKRNIFRVVGSVRTAVLALSLALVASIASQAYVNINTHAANTLPGNNEVISVATTDGFSPNASLSLLGASRNGNVILFYSTATNLSGAGGLRYSTQGGIFTYDISTNTTTRMDIAASGALPDWGSKEGIISGSGRYVYFVSSSTNLIDGSTQYRNNAYIRDLQTGTITAATNEYWGDYSLYIDWPMAISNDGRFIMFASNRTDIGNDNYYNAILGDRKSGSFALTSLGQANSINYVDVNRGGMSCDGSLAAYVKSGYLYFVDSRNGTPSTSIMSGGTSAAPIISCNGEYILYATQNRTDVPSMPGGLSSYMHLVKYNRITGQRNYIDSNSSGVFNSATYTYAPLATPASNSNLFDASIADTGDVVFKYNGNY